MSIGLKVTTKETLETTVNPYKRSIYSKAMFIEDIVGSVNGSSGTSEVGQKSLYQVYELRLDNINDRRDVHALVELMQGHLGDINGVRDLQTKGSHSVFQHLFGSIHYHHLQDLYTRAFCFCHVVPHKRLWYLQGRSPGYAHNGLAQAQHKFAGVSSSSNLPLHDSSVLF
nr:hypothetical protein HmN_000999800 [Hymenolepis microstoma]